MLQSILSTLSIPAYPPEALYMRTKTGGGSLPDKRERLWLDGGDANLFSVKFGDPIPFDWSGDGVIDSIQYSRRIEAVRPLPEGEYKFHYNNRKVFFIPCDGYTIRYEWTVTVTALPARSMKRSSTP